MSFVSSADIPRVVTSQTSPLTAPKVLFPNGGQLPSVRCCDTGRPVALDPVTGSTVCSCQLKNGIPAYLSRVPSLPETVYGTGNSNFIPPNAVMGADAAAVYYHMQGLQQGLKSPDRQPEGTVKPGQHPAHPPYYLEHLMAAHTYNAFYSGLDMNSARRKNATRETTSALKAWLYEHRKNPYPTKGEKIMLAIITRMTLTQVSTWFANARRRLKKENKLDGADDNLSDIDIDDPPSMKSLTPCDLSPKTSTYSDEDRRRSVDDGDLSDISDVDDSACHTDNTDIEITSKYSGKQRTDSNEMGIDLNKPNQTTITAMHASNYVNGIGLPLKRPEDIKTKESTCDSSKCVSATSKPKIWSISEIINSSKETDTKSDDAS